MVTTSLKLVIFGLSISSSWGNGHATLWRGLCRALGRRGHRVVFFEKDVPYYASTRDMTDIPGCELRLYENWDEVLPHARRNWPMPTWAWLPPTVRRARPPRGRFSILGHAYVASTIWIPRSPSRVCSRACASTICRRTGLRGFDLVLSYTGGEALHWLKTLLGARRVAPLYGSVDPEIHQPARSSPRVSVGPFLSRHLCRRSSGNTGPPLHPGGTSCPKPKISDRWSSISKRFSMDEQHLFRPPPSTCHASCVL